MMFADRAEAIRQIEWQCADYMAQLNRIMPVRDIKSPDFHTVCELMELVAENRWYQTLLETDKAPTASQCLRNRP
jgi:hypothetical protein